jgi:hypothetical protein
MRIRGIRLPDTETFPCSRRRVKELFGETELAWVSFGSPIRTFSFDGRMSQRPRLVGPVVAALSIDRARAAHLCLYPVRRASYLEAARSEFSTDVLPHLRRWLCEKRSQPETAILGHEEMVVEWTGQAHRVHELRPFLSRGRRFRAGPRAHRSTSA